MNVILIFVWIWSAFIAMSFWESSIESRNPWAKNSSGWKIKITKNNSLTRYHFFIIVMWAFLLTLPLAIYGWDLKLFGVIISAYFSGIVIEDFFWFITNPKVKLKEFTTNFTNYYPWIKLGKRKIPTLYIISLAIAILSWGFIWRI